MGTATLDGTGNATFSTQALSVANHSISAVYNGDGNFIGSTSGSYADTVSQAGSAVAVTSSPDSPVFGQAVTFTATVSALTLPSPQGGEGSIGPTGTVSFVEGATTLASGVVVLSGQATFSTTALTAGSHTVTASYSGDGNFIAGSGDDSSAAGGRSSFVEHRADSAGQLVLSVIGLQPGADLHGHRDCRRPRRRRPTGTVTFLDGTVYGTTSLGSGVLSGGQATLSTAGLAIGYDTITASYGGDSNFLNSSGDDSAAPQLVLPDYSSTGLTSTSNPSVFGQAVTFTATVDARSPGSASPTGSVEFLEGSTTLAPSVTLVGGLATFSTAALGIGSHTITANYDGDGDFMPSSADDSAAPQVVTQDSSTTTVTSTANPSVFGQAVIFTATVSPAAPGSGTATGSVTFTEGNTTLVANVALNSSAQATFSIAALAVGSNTITAVYNGDGNFKGSTSAAYDETISQAPTTVALTSSPGTTAYLQNVTFTATVTSGAPGRPRGRSSLPKARPCSRPGGAERGPGDARLAVSFGGDAYDHGVLQRGYDLPTK